MDSKKFDVLTRGFGTQRTRREAVKGFAAGLLGLGVVRGASAQVSVERATCGQSCTVSGDCNAGLRCVDTGSSNQCIAIRDSNEPCNENSDCANDYEVCNSSLGCINQSDCNICVVSADCTGDEICRNGRCGAEDECDSDNDCRRRQRCRRGQCVRRRR